LGTMYLMGAVPSWVNRALNGGLLTPLIKQAAPAGCTPDARPTNASDSDVALWRKVAQRNAVDEVRKIVEPQQLAVGVSGGVEMKVVGIKLEMEAATRAGLAKSVTTADVKNAHNAYDRVRAQEQINLAARKSEVGTAVQRPSSRLWATSGHLHAIIPWTEGFHTPL
jgi:hypothetical protein